MAKAQRTTQVRDVMYMEKFADANPNVVAAELAFYAEKGTERRKKEDEKHARRIKAEVNDLFD